MRKATSILFALAVSNIVAVNAALAVPKFTTTKSAPDNIDYSTWHDASRNRDLPIKIYKPTTGSAPYPVVIFSHGLGGSREAAEYLGYYWSQHGYFCVFVQHPGSDSSVWQSAIGQGRAAMKQRMNEAANGKNLVARAEDVTFVIDELTKQNQTGPYAHKLDLKKLAVAGHSFGAGTALVIAGEAVGNGNTLCDPRVKSAIYLCPPVMARNLPRTQVYSGIHLPGLLLTGTEDNSPIGLTTAAERRIPFDSIQAPHQFLVNFYGANHAMFGGGGLRLGKQGDDDFHSRVDKITTEFLDATLKNEKSAWDWLNSKQSSEYLAKVADYERK